MTESYIRIDGSVYWLWALFLLVLPFPWVAAAFTAALVHELFHVCMLRICGRKVDSIKVGPFGAALETYGMMPGEEFLCALAGPAGSFLLLLLGRWLPRLAVCGLVQGLFNLLPVYPLDGGRALRYVLQWLVPDHSETAEKIVTAAAVMSTFLISVFFLRELLIVSGILLIRSGILRKRP